MVVLNPEVAKSLPPTEVKKLESSGQDQLLKTVESMPPKDREVLKKQLESGLPERISRAKKLFDVATKYKPSPFERPDPSKMVERGNEELGKKALTAGQVAVVILAGGQGSRLGSKSPKGCYDLGLKSKRSLFAIHAERLRKTSPGTPLYILVSTSTSEETRRHFKDNNNFGLKSVSFVEQESLPAFDSQKQVFFESPGRVFEAPSGNGNFFPALKKSGALEEFKKKGIKYVHTFPVDNVLSHPAEPTFIGLAIERQSDFVSKAVERIRPEEAVGVFAQDPKSKTLRVVEYSELPKEAAKEKERDGSLTYRYANIASHVFTTPFLESVAEKYEKSPESTFPWRIARKSASAFDPPTGSTRPTECAKLEVFIFDALTYSKNPMVYIVSRDKEFAPLKNGPDSKEDNPSTCKRALETNGEF